MMDSKTSNQVKHELHQIKRINHTLLSPHSPSQAFKVWSSILQIVAFLDLISFLYVNKIRLERERIEEILKARSRIRKLFIQGLTLIGFQSHESIDMHTSATHWIERVYPIFDIIFCICWILEGLRLAWKKANIHYVDMERISESSECWNRCIAFIVFASIVLFYVMFLPVKWIAKVLKMDDHHGMISNLCKSKDCTTYSIQDLILLLYIIQPIKAINSRTMIMKLTRKLSKAARYVIKHPISIKRRIVQAIIAVKTIKRILPKYFLISNMQKRI